MQFNNFFFKKAIICAGTENKIYINKLCKFEASSA